MNSPNKENNQIEAKAKKFSELFHGGKFEVPWHQRRYDWKKEHVSDLLHDINEAFEENHECYFLGALILVKKEDNTWEINDGQQRMVTYSLICACLCRLFEEESDHFARAVRILFDIDGNSPVESSMMEHYIPRLTPPSNDKTRYNLMIRGQSIGANGKLTAAWRSTEDFIAGMGEDRAKKFFDFLIQKVVIACLDIRGNIDPNSVYETINCRGKQLEEFDLLRNYLYSHFNSKEEQRRNTVHENLERIPDQLRRSEYSMGYARCYFQCKFGFLPKNKFYREARKKIRETIDEKKKLSDYIFDLVHDFSRQDSIELFHLIIKPDSNPDFIEEFKKTSATSTNKRNLLTLLEELKNYTVTSPVIFALLRRYYDTKLSDIPSKDKKRFAKNVYRNIRNINSFTMRVAFISPKFEPSHFETEFSSLAKKIMSMKSLYELDVLNFLHECDNAYNVIDNKKFIDKLATATITDSRRIKLFLWGVNHCMQTDGEIIQARHCNIEHILPKSEEHWSSWKEFKNDEAKDYIHRLGNLTLLGGNENKPGKETNSSFLKKREILTRSGIKLTKEVGKEKTWSPEIIDLRQKELAKVSAEVWRFNHQLKYSGT